MGNFLLEKYINCFVLMYFSVESGWDNPFRPDGDLSKEADQIVELIKEGKPINDETLRSISPSVNGEMMHTSNYTNNLTVRIHFRLPLNFLI